MSAFYKREMFVGDAAESAPGMACAAFPPFEPGPAALSLINLSPSGFSARDEGAFEAGDLIGLVLPGLGPVRAQVARRGEGRLEGRFLDSDSLRLRFLNGLRGSGGAPRIVPAIRCGPGS